MLSGQQHILENLFDEEIEYYMVIFSGDRLQRPHKPTLHYWEMVISLSCRTCPSHNTNNSSAWKNQSQHIHTSPLFSHIKINSIRPVWHFVSRHDFYILNKQGLLQNVSFLSFHWATSHLWRGWQCAKAADFSFKKDKSFFFFYLCCWIEGKCFSHLFDLNTLSFSVRLQLVSGCINPIPQGYPRHTGLK